MFALSHIFNSPYAAQRTVLFLALILDVKGWGRPQRYIPASFAHVCFVRSFTPRC
jgi:hypothetical protein